MNRWTEADIPDQTGRTVIVTGANSGLGYVSSLELARRGARVVMAVRDRAKGEQAAGRIRREVPGAELDLRLIDLADLDSVRAFAAGIEGRVDVLMNNAGVMMPPRTLTKQGFELQFGANHLGHFALTSLLMDRVADDGRVVTVSAYLHQRGSIHFEDLNGERKYSPLAFYAQSKYANVLFGLELDRRLRAAGSGIRSLLAHPGYSTTNLQTSGPNRILGYFLGIGNRVAAQSAEMGALDQLYAAVAPAAQGGQFIGPHRGLRGYPVLVQPLESAKDPELARRLWTVSEELTGVRFDQLTP